jgi:SagB-type dehydrogenase family enzyme
MKILSILLLFLGCETATLEKEVSEMKITLPKDFSEGKSLERAISERRSVRDYGTESVTLQELSSLLFYGDGLTCATPGFRAAPSAGALYPIEIYVVVNRGEGIEKGIYHYQPKDHSLVLIKEGDFSAKIANACLGQHFLAEASCVFIMSSVWHRMMRKYGERGIRYIYLEAGHIAQNITLEAVSLELSTCAVGAFYDDEVNQLIGLDGKTESVIYILSCGRERFR